MLSRFTDQSYIRLEGPNNVLDVREIREPTGNYRLWTYLGTMIQSALVRLLWGFPGESDRRKEDYGETAQNNQKVFKGCKQAPVTRDVSTAEYRKLLSFPNVNPLGVAQTDMGIFGVLHVFTKTEKLKKQILEFS